MLKNKTSFGTATIQPMIDKETGKPITNVKAVRSFFKVLTKLRNSPIEEDQLQYNKIINGDETIYQWFKQINDEPNDILAQSLINKTLIPIPISQLPKENKTVANSRGSKAKAKTTQRKAK